MKLDVRAGGYDTAAEALFTANATAAGAYARLTRTLGGFHALGGDDTSSEDFVREYDGAAQEAVDAFRALVAGLGSLGEVTASSARNHREANAGSVYNRPRPGVEGAQDAAESAPAFSPPTSLGGDNTDMPDWWNHVVDHLQGWGWPSANTGQLREAAQAWRAAGSEVGWLTANLDSARAQLAQQRSPEISTALGILRTTGANVTELSSCLVALGDACDDYATQVEQTRQTIKDLLRDLAIECGVTAGISVGLSFVTFGGAAAVGAGVIAARAARYATRIIAALKALRAARAVITVSRHAPRLNRVRRAFENLKTARALVKLKTIARPRMTSNLKQLEKKFKHADALDVTTPRGKQGFQDFKKAIDDFMDSPAVKHRDGTYRGDPVTLSVNPSTGQCVILKPDGSFLSAWRLNQQQLENVIRTGKLGGG